MHPTGINPELALVALRRDADERLGRLRSTPRATLRARVGRRLMAWGARLAPPERDPAPTTRWAATMVP